MRFTLIALSCIMLTGCFATTKPAKTEQLILQVPPELLEKPEALKKL